MASRNAQALGKLAEWGERFGEVASRGHKSALSKEMGRETLDLIEDGFRKESTPYGQKWRPKKRPNGQQILVEREHMRHRFRARVGLGKFTITNPQPYTNTHNYGDPERNIPKRQMWPSPNRLPARWVRKYTSVFQKRTFNILMGRKVRR